jgi:hypothetical protein
MTASLGITSPPDQTTTADYGHTNAEMPAIAAAIIRKPSQVPDIVTSWGGIEPQMQSTSVHDHGLLGPAHA